MVESDLHAFHRGPRPPRGEQTDVPVPSSVEIVEPISPTPPLLATALGLARLSLQEQEQQTGRTASVSTSAATTSPYLASAASLSSRAGRGGRGISTAAAASSSSSGEPGRGGGRGTLGTAPPREGTGARGRGATASTSATRGGVGHSLGGFTSRPRRPLYDKPTRGRDANPHAPPVSVARIRGRLGEPFLSRIHAYHQHIAAREERADLINDTPYVLGQGWGSLSALGDDMVRTLASEQREDVDHDQAQGPHEHPPSSFSSSTSTPFPSPPAGPVEILGARYTAIAEMCRSSSVAFAAAVAGTFPPEAEAVAVQVAEDNRQEALSRLVATDTLLSHAVVDEETRRWRNRALRFLLDDGLDAPVDHSEGPEWEGAMAGAEQLVTLRNDAEATWRRWVPDEIPLTVAETNERVLGENQHQHHVFSRTSPSPSPSSSPLLDLVAGRATSRSEGVSVVCEADSEEMVVLGKVLFEWQRAAYQEEVLRTVGEPMLASPEEVAELAAFTTGLEKGGDNVDPEAVVRRLEEEVGKLRRAQGVLGASQGRLMSATVPFTEAMPS